MTTSEISTCKSYADDYEIILTTMTGGNTHDGYCSGADARAITPIKKTRRVKIAKGFVVKDSWKRCDGRIVLCPSNPTVRSIIGTYPIMRHCDLGSGFCGCTSTEKVIDVNIVLKSMIPDDVGY